MNRKEYFTCPLRTLEGERLYHYLQNKNKEFTLTGSCVVTKSVEKKVIDAINNHEGPVIVFGCISETVQAEINKKNAEVIKTTQLLRAFQKGSSEYEGIENTDTCYTFEEKALCERQYDDIIRLNQNFFQKIINKNSPIPFLVVAQGCNNKCAFCHTKFYIGKVISKPVEKIKLEYKELIKRKYRFINIISEDIGSYGTDIGTSLPSLLNELDKLSDKDKTQWMLDGLQPRHYIEQSDSLKPFIHKKRITAICIPVQSGSNRILKLMNREHERKEAIECLKNFRSLNPKLYLQGIFIVGFPSETKEDFNDTLNFITDVKFNDITLTPYSEFSLCESSGIKEKIPATIINDRISCGAKILKNAGIKGVRGHQL